MTMLTLFGLCAVSAAVFFYAMENFSHWFVLALAVANALGRRLCFYPRRVALWFGRNCLDARGFVALGAEAPGALKNDAIGK